MMIRNTYKCKTLDLRKFITYSEISFNSSLDQDGVMDKVFRHTKRKVHRHNPELLNLKIRFRNKQKNKN